MLSTTEPGSHESMQVPTTSTAFNASQPRTHNTVPCSVESSSRYLSAHLLTFHTKWNILDKHYDITSRYGLRYRYQHTVRKAVYKHRLFRYRMGWSNTQSQRRLDDSFRGVLACVRSSHRSRYFYTIYITRVGWWRSGSETDKHRDMPDKVGIQRMKKKNKKQT